MKPILQFSLTFFLILVNSLAIAQSENVTGTTENHAPVFVKEMPDTTVSAGNAIQFSYKAIDSDGDSVKYFAESLVPTNSFVNAAEGKLFWRPSLLQLGINYIQIHATDGKDTTLSRITVVTVLDAMTSDGGFRLYVDTKPPDGGLVLRSFTSTSATLTARANKGYRFINWSNENSVLSSDSIYTLPIKNGLFENDRANIFANFRVNHAPVFVKEMPDTTILPGKTFTFQCKAIDPDGDSITYSVKSILPINAIFITTTGYFSWRPINSQHGKLEIVIEATDGKLNTSSRKSTITVLNTVDIFGGIVNYSCIPTDGGTIIVSIINDTVTAIAKPNKGFVVKNWTNNGSIVSTDSIYVFKYPVVTHTYNIVANFRVNHAPVFVKEMPDTMTYEGGNFVFTYKAIDPDGDTVKYYSTSIFPSNGMIVSHSGVFGWRPNHFQSGLFHIMIYASDGNMITYSRRASVKIYPDCCISGPPIIIRGLPEGGGSVSYNMAHDTITAIAVSNKGFKFLNWTEYGTLVSTDSAYSYVVTETRNLAAHFTSTSSLYDKMGLPKEYSLSQNYPNPFNPETTISYSLPKSEYVTLKIFDVLGREIATLVNEAKAPGNYSVKFNGSNLPSAIYFYQMTTQSKRITNKMNLMK